MTAIFSWQQAEELAAAHMRSIGFLDAVRTREGADGGLDVVSGNAVAQVKHHQAKTGAPDVQRLRGAGHKYPHLIFYSSAGYTAAAIATADDCGVSLFTYTETNEVTPVNPRAEQLHSREVSMEMMTAALNEGRRIVLRTRAWNSAVAAFSDVLSAELASIQAEAERQQAVADAGGDVPPQSASALQQRYEELMLDTAFIREYMTTYQQPLRVKMNAFNDAIEYMADHPGPGLPHVQELVADYNQQLHELRDDVETRRPELVTRAHGALKRFLESDDESALGLREAGLTAEL